MTGTIPIPMVTAVLPAVEHAEPTEIVKGNEQNLLAKFLPLVRRQNVTLDLNRIERIDAAGISALLTLYTSARATGHFFTVTNPSSHVAEILALVGLQQVLLSHNVVRKSHSAIHHEALVTRKYLSRLRISA
jgi:anti-anti-sigma factor